MGESERWEADVYEMRAQEMESVHGRVVLRWHAVRPSTRTVALCGHALMPDAVLRAIEVATEEYCAPCVDAVQQAMRQESAGA
jgi:hypothetical protein